MNSTNDPNFPAYRAKVPGRTNPAKAALRELRRLVYSVAFFPYGVRKHERLLATCDRTNSHTYTCFLRAPSQLVTIVGPVLDYLDRPQDTGRRLEILTFACSNGAEVYTLASFLSTHMPKLDFHINASDLHQEMVDRCLAAEYSVDEALQSDYVTPRFVHDTFDQRGDRYVVKSNIRQKVTFRQASLLDSEGLPQLFAPADIVTAQNVLFHLKPADTRTAFANVASFLKPKSVLLVEGMDPELRIELTRLHGLTPLVANLKSIYSETRIHTPRDWWNYYWGTEPYFPLRKDKERRYGTIFLRG